MKQSLNGKSYDYGGVFQPEERRLFSFILFTCLVLPNHSLTLHNVQVPAHCFVHIESNVIALQPRAGNHGCAYSQVTEGCCKGGKLAIKLFQSVITSNDDWTRGVVSEDHLYL